DRLSGGKAIVASDVGQHQMWAAQLVRFNEPRLWINSGGLGSMGFGLPAAIGAQFACPEKLVFAIVGDGGFQMSIPELATIANHKLPVKIVVMNNGYLGMVRQWQELFYNNRLSEVALTCFPDVEKLAGAYGFTGRTVENVADMPRALEEAVRTQGPYLLNVKVSAFENVFPMVPAGGAINEMVLRPPQPVEV
ncbi:MAG: acetolactate synthase large subunit, partial [Acidobacteriaceae bacterium]|nr:acetolactate synthase large subunit [Acidobacteriaceae bacterium]